MTIHLPKDKENIFLPVIHTLDSKQVIENAQIAFENGADGIMLNNHPSQRMRELYDISMNTSEELINIFVKKVKEAFPDRFVGINDLCHYNDPVGIFSLVEKTWVDGIRVDKPYIGALHQEHKADDVCAAQKNHNRRWLYMWGVNFKYVDESKHLSAQDLEVAAPRLKSYLDIIVTTWAGTGKAADLEKMKMFARIFGRENVGLASGVTPENYRSYQDYARVFMVATGIQQTPRADWQDLKRVFHYLDPQKVSNLSSQMTAYNINEIATPLFGKQASMQLYDALSASSVVNISYLPYDRDSLGSMLSNLYPASFTLDNVEYASVEAFWMSLKFPPTDPRKEEVRAMSGIKAKMFGAPMKGCSHVFYQGREIVSGSVEHHALLKAAVRAKINQNPQIYTALIRSGYQPLVHIPLMDNGYVYPDSQTIPTKIFAQMVGEIREECRMDMRVIGEMGV